MAVVNEAKWRNRGRLVDHRDEVLRMLGTGVPLKVVAWQFGVSCAAVSKFRSRYLLAAPPAAPAVRSVG